jgi:hypothetical protein
VLPAVQAVEIIDPVDTKQHGLANDLAKFSPNRGEVVLYRWGSGSLPVGKRFSTGGELPPHQRALVRNRFGTGSGPVRKSRLYYYSSTTSFHLTHRSSLQATVLCCSCG